MRAAPSLTFEILGSLSIRRGDQAVTLRSPLQRKVLAALLVADRAVLPDELIDVLWGERPPATAMGTLHTHVSRLRTTLDGGPDLLESDARGYRLVIETADVDARRFDQSVADGIEAARAGRSREARALLTDGLALWRGPALLDFRYEPFAQTEITRLEGLRLTAWEERLALELDDGLHAEAVRTLEVLVQDHPLHEGLHELLMVGLYRSGRQADALAVYEQLRVSLRDQLGLEPTPQLRTLEHDILSHAPTLSISPPSSALASPGDLAVPQALELQRWIEQLDVPALDDRMTCELLLARGDGQRRSGKEQEARRSYAAAVRLATTSSATEQLAAAALGLAGPPEDTLLGEPLDESLMQQSIAALPDNRSVGTMLRARLAVALIDRGEAERGEHMADAAVSRARSVGDAPSLAYALRARHRTWFEPAALVERLAIGSELIGVGAELGDEEVSAWGHRWQAIDLLETGDLAAFERELDALEGLATQLHDAFQWWGVIIRRAGLALLTGPPDKAEPLIMEALGLAEQIHSPYTMSASLLTLWALRWQQGRLAEIEDAVLDIEQGSPAFGFLVPFLHRQLGRADDAARTFEALARDDFAELPGLTAVAPIHQPLGQLRALMGDREGSEEHFEAAISRCREIGARTLEARARLAYAEVLQGFGDATAVRRAEELRLDAAAELGTAEGWGR